MFKTFIMMVTGFIIGMILSENAQVIHHSIPREGNGTGNASGNINQFIFILGIGNSGNSFTVNAGDETVEEETEV